MAKRKPKEVPAENVLEWANGARRAKYNIIEVNDALEEVRQSDPEQVLRPEAIVESARNRTSVLHDMFEWDDSKAATQYRLDQATTLIRSVKIRYASNPKQPQRRFSVDERAHREQGQRAPYSPTEELMADPEARAVLLQRALGELLAMQRKFRHLQELAVVFAAIDKVLVDLEPPA